MTVSRLLIFDISGPFAHFRKYYTNASSLTYLIPPRTVLVGLIAGILGINKDCYYEDFNETNCKIAVKTLSKSKKLMQNINLRSTQQGFSKYNKVPNPTNIEILRPAFPDKLNKFRIYVSFQDNQISDSFKKKWIKVTDNKSFNEELVYRVKNQRYVYNAYLGLTEFLANIKFIDFTDNIQQLKYTSTDFIDISTAINREVINEIQYFQGNEVDLQYITERMPISFGSERTLKTFGNFIFEINGNIVSSKLKQEQEYYKIIYQEKNKTEKLENIMFLE